MNNKEYNIKNNKIINKYSILIEKLITNNNLSKKVIKKSIKIKLILVTQNIIIKLLKNYNNKLSINIHMRKITIIIIIIKIKFS